MVREVRKKKLRHLKLLIAVPLVWFCIVGVTAVFTGRELHVHIYDAQDDLMKKDYIQLNLQNEGNQIGNILQLKDQHPDWLRVQGEMKEDLADQLRLIEQYNRLKNLQKPKKDGVENKLRPHGMFSMYRKLNEQEIPELDFNAPGENGTAVSINKTLLSGEELEKYEEGFKRNAFNQYASDMMSLHRTLNDPRNRVCQSRQYADNLPDTSIIIIFHNEAWSILLRTVFSCLDRSPPNLVREIILVDDFSDFDHLKSPLDEFVSSQPKVRLVRAKKREGLIRARLLGASIARGTVLTFLDSHCECAMGWLEPLLHRIAQNDSNVVCPEINSITDDTLAFKHGAKSMNVGGFDWNLVFNWHPIPQHEKDRLLDESTPIRSPTMAGGLFSISKHYFEYLGTYDTGMDIWGGENLELSFKIWMCGGTLEIVPCSHVGHIFRTRSPYKWPKGIGVKKNTIRLAEVWLDDYSKYFYERFNHSQIDYGDVSSRKALRQRLQCKSFKWYLDNIFPELYIPSETLASGEIRAKVHGNVNGILGPVCLDSRADPRVFNKPVNLWPCHGLGSNQFWLLTPSGEIRRDVGCLDYAGKFLMVYACHGKKGNQEWIYQFDNTIRHKKTKLCIALSEDGTKLEMKSCAGTDRQIFQWKRIDV